MIIPVVNQKSDVPGAGPHYSVSCKRVGRLRYKCTSFFMRYINLVRLFNLRIPIFSSKHKDGCMYFWELWRKLTKVKFKTHNEKEQSKSPPVPSSWEMGESLNTSGSTCVFFLLYFCQSVCLSLYISIINLLTQHKQNFTYVWTFFFYINRVTAVWYRLAWVRRLVKFSLALLDCRGFPWRFGKVRDIIKHSFWSPQTTAVPGSALTLHSMGLSLQEPSPTDTHLCSLTLALWIFPLQEPFTMQMGDPRLLSPAIHCTSAASCQHPWKWSLLSNIMLLTVKCKHFTTPSSKPCFWFTCNIFPSIETFPSKPLN